MHELALLTVSLAEQCVFYRREWSQPIIQIGCDGNQSRVRGKRSDSHEESASAAMRWPRMLGVVVQIQR